MDITILYITLNKMPKEWVDFHQHNLKLAIGDTAIVSVSRIPINLGTNIIDTDKPCYSNIYRQMLRASHIAKTKYVAMVEDDVLYHSSHFEDCRPKDDEFAYNRHRWSAFSWGSPQYSLRNRLSNCSMIAPRLLLIDTLQEIFDKYNNNPPDDRMGECGRLKVAQRLKTTPRKMIEFRSRVGIVQLNHPLGTEDRQQQQWKSHARIRAYDIPHWGKAADVIKHYNTSS